MKKLKEIREKTGLNQKEFANVCGIPSTTYNQYENGKREPDVQTLELLANKLNVSIDEIFGREEKTKKGYRIPVFGNVAAGIPISAIEDIVDYEEISENDFDGGEYFGLVIKGDSMEPRMTTGDVVIVRSQSTIENGEIAIVLVNGDEATCKKIKKTPEGVILLSNNPNYEPLFYSNKQIEQLPVCIIGKVVELRAKFN